MNEVVTELRACSRTLGYFTPVRSRIRKTEGCLSRETALSMVFKLMMSAKKKWRKLSGTNRLPEVIQGLEFKDGIKQLQNAA